MKIENLYIVWYETETGIIMNDYTVFLKGANIAAPSIVTIFCAETVAEIDAKVIELGLTDPNELVSSH